MSPNVENEPGTVEMGIVTPPTPVNDVGVAVEKPKEDTHVVSHGRIAEKGAVADNGVKEKKKVRFAMPSHKLFSTMGKFILGFLALIAIIILSVQINNDRQRIEKLSNELNDMVMTSQTKMAVAPRITGDASYLDGISAMIEDDTVALAPVNRDVTDLSSVIATSTTGSYASSTSDTCDDETDAATPMANDSASSVVPFVNTTSLVFLTTITTPMTTSVTVTFNNSIVSGISSADVFTVSPFLTASTSDTEAITIASATLTTSESCGEWGDGAGPCTRSYGAPNTTPGSVVGSDSAASIMPSTTGDIPVPSDNPALSSADAISASAPASVATSSIDSSICVASTATLYVTVTVGPSLSSVTPIATESVTVTITAPATSSSMSAPLPVTDTTDVSSTPSITLTTISGSTIVRTTTSSMPRTVVTQTLPVSSAPNTNTSISTSTVTSWANSTTSSMFVPPITLTFTTHPGQNATATESNSPIGTIPVVVSGGNPGPKPMGANGNGQPGNGMYCVVMLAALAALLI